LPAPKASSKLIDTGAPSQKETEANDSVLVSAHMGLIVRLTALAGIILLGGIMWWNNWQVNSSALALVAAWLVGFALFLSAGFVRHVTRPVIKLAERLNRVDLGRPKQSVLAVPASHVTDEIGLVIRSVNKLLLRLDGSIARENMAKGLIQEHEIQLNHLFDTVLDGILVLAEDMTIRRSNSAATKLIGLNAMELNGRHFGDFILQNDRQDIVDRLYRLNPAGQPTLLQITLLGAEHKNLLLDLNAKMFETAQRRGCILVLRDISHSYQTQKNLLLSEQRLQLAVKATRSAIWDQDLANDTYWWSSELLNMLGYSEGEFSPSHETKVSLVHEEDVEWVKTSIDRYLRREIPTYNPEFRVHRKDGTWLWVEDRGTAEWDITGKPLRFSGIMSDCSERKQFEQQLMYMATHDPLTNLPNRTLLLDRLDHALLHATRKGLMVGALLIDIDRFKLINDSLGHNVGDQLIKAVANRLQQNLRPSDTLARLAIDEFVVICEDLPTPQEAARVAKRLLSTLSQSFTVEGHHLHISVSVGISVSPSDGNSPQDMLRHADTAMHSAKANGGHCYRFFIADMDRDAVARLMLERQLIDAIERQQFVLHYQPKIDIATRQPMGFEALIRWPHRLLGNMSPVSFIPVAEETGQIIAIGEWVIREALSQICAWRDKGLVPLPVSINISGKQLMAGGVDELILPLLREYDVPPALLEIEITESAVMTKLEKILPVLHHLRESGVGISLDDFGTGYSSLSYLRQIPISVLKIDRSFVRDVPHKAEANSIAGIILAVGQQLGIKVVAEGIETEEQLEFLKNNKCDVAQGWLFYKALPPNKAEALLARKNP